VVHICFFLQRDPVIVGFKGNKGQYLQYMRFYAQKTAVTDFDEQPDYRCKEYPGIISNNDY